MFDGDKEGYIELQMDSGRSAAPAETRKKEYIVARINNKGIPTNLARGSSNRDFDPSPENSVDDDDDHREEDVMKPCHSLVSPTGVLLNNKQIFENSMKSDQSHPGEISYPDKKVKVNQHQLQFTDHEEGIRQKFKPYKDIINNLTNMYSKETDYDIISCTFTSDSSLLIVVLKVDDEHYIINQYRTDNFKRTVSLDVKGNYIKVKDVVQNKFGKLFCAPYLDDGVFRLLIFNSYEALDQPNLNTMLKLDNSTRPNDNFPDPMMGATFNDYNNIFVNVFYTKTKTVYFCKYSFSHKKLLDEPIMIQMEQSRKNFPLDIFFDNDRDYVYIFYRQGESITIDLSHHNRWYKDQVINFDIGSTFLYNNQILIVNSSSQILFYSLHWVTTLITKKAELRWQKYHMLDIQGFIEFSKGSNRFQVITDKLIFYYIFDT